MMIKGIAWFGMTVLALAVTGYACALLLAAQIPPAFAQAVFTQMPTVTVWHLAGSAIALAVGAFQVNARLRARFLRIHRWLGRLYVLRSSSAELRDLRSRCVPLAGSSPTWDSGSSPSSGSQARSLPSATFARAIAMRTGNG